MPLKFEGLRRLPGSKKLAFLAGLGAWFSKQSVPRRIGLGAALYLIIALTAYAAFGGNACAVTVNGKTIAIAADEKSARAALDELIKLKSSQVGEDVSVAERISYRGIRVNQDELLDRESLKGKLEQVLSFKARCTAVLVNGEAKVYLKHKEDAETLLAWLKTVYPAQAGEQLGFKEKIQLAAMPVDAAQLLDLEAAKKLVLLGTTKVEQYTVKNGDTLWDIAHAAKTDVDQLQLANPGQDLNHLSVGQVLDLSREAPLITVVATRQETLQEEIPYQVDVKKDDKLLLGEKKVICEGAPGERTVTYRITSENGLETGREVLEQNVICEATTEVVAKGTQTILASRGGSGRMSWPASGGILSPFGIRDGRRHEGVDIGASYGSAVTAAAGGTITATGWESGYGNTVEISHGGGVMTRYAHLSAIKVSNGQTVERGQLVGLVGDTGRATCAHLHFEVRLNGQPHNPLDYLP